jgi:hypothetical protein
MDKEWANKDRYHPSHGLPEHRMPLPKGKGFHIRFRLGEERVHWEKGTLL